MTRRRLFLSFYAEPNRDYVFGVNFVLAACAGVAAAMYTPLAWWSIAVGAGILAVLELALHSRYTAWFSIAIGTAASAAVAAIGLFAAGAAITQARVVWWIAAAIGAAVGAWLMIDAHRKLRRRRAT